MSSGEKKGYRPKEALSAYIIATQGELAAMDRIEDRNAPAARAET